MLQFKVLIISLLILSCKTGSNSNVRNENTKKENVKLFVGTYTHNSESEGIYVLDFNIVTGELKNSGITFKTENSSFLALHPTKKWLYSVNETNEDSLDGSGRISVFEFDTSTWKNTILQSVSSFGSSPCHISINNKGNYCYTANYGGGNVSAYRILDNGKFSANGLQSKHVGNGPHPNQKSARAHMILPNTDNNLVYAVDLGTDKVYIYDSLLRNTGNDFHLPPGTGPRHMRFHPFKDWAYVLGELNGTISSCTIEENTGRLNSFQVISTVDTTLELEPKSADIRIHPNGKFLYASNRGELNNIAIFSIDLESGMLKYLTSHSTKGKTPRNFIIDPSGKFLLVANQDSSNIVVFNINPSNGSLIETNYQLKLPKPVCLLFYDE